MTHHRGVLVAPTKAAGNIFLNELCSHTLVASEAGGTSISGSFLNGSLSFRTAVVVVAIPEALSVGRVDASLIIETAAFARTAVKLESTKDLIEGLLGNVNDAKLGTVVGGVHAVLAAPLVGNAVGVLAVGAEFQEVEAVALAVTDGTRAVRVADVVFHNVQEFGFHGGGGFLGGTEFGVVYLLGGGGRKEKGGSDEGLHGC